MAILMPALNMARKQGQRAVCQNNLRQQHVACSMYIDDFEGYFPCTEQINAYLWGGKNGTELGSAGANRFLNPYICKEGEVTTKSTDKQLEVFKCPGDRGNMAGNWPTRMPSVWDCTGSSYLPNFTANTNNIAANGLWQKKIIQVRNSSSLIMVREFSFMAFFRSPEGSYGGVPFGYFYWHKNNYNGWGNVTFVDGHTEYLQATQDKPDYQNGDGWTFIVNKK